MLLCVLGSAPAAAADIIALVTKVAGDVVLTGPKDQPLTEPFIKLREADVLRLGAGGALTLTFFESGRQETWRGPGSIKLAAEQSLPAGGSPVLNVKQLPVNLVRQLARTPAPDTEGNVGMLRLRSIPTAEALAKLEKTYGELRAAAGPGDRDPDLYWLSGLFDLHEYDRLQTELARLTEANRDDFEIKVLNKLYARAINDAKRSAN
jgi:hypothetical protein